MERENGAINAPPHFCFIAAQFSVVPWPSSTRIFIHLTPASNVSSHFLVYQLIRHRSIPVEPSGNAKNAPSDVNFPEMGGARAKMKQGTNRKIIMIKRRRRRRRRRNGKSNEIRLASRWRPRPPIIFECVKRRIDGPSAPSPTSVIRHALSLP